jgi:sugar/nucleoside kinase (ribokinase family)
VPPDLIVVGDVMVDVGVDAGELSRGGDVHGEVRLRPGGSAANAAVWAASTGAHVRLHGRVGDDLPGHLLARELEERGVEPALAVDPSARTGAVLSVREPGERSMVADRGANARLSPGDLPDRLEAGAVLVSGYLLFHPGSEPAARAALDRAEAGHVAVDAASWPLVRDYGADRFLEATAPATLLLANDREAEILAGAPGEDAVPVLLGSYACVAVKMGARGALIASADGMEQVGTPAVDEADPTGAGDAFDGVLLAALARGSALAEAARAACEAGARAAASPDPWPVPA